MPESDLSAASITSDLGTDLIGQRVLYYPRLTTTMETARQEALRGAAEGTTVIAGEQTAALGFIVQGGTLTTPGLLFVNRCSWAHILEASAHVLNISRETLITPEEQAALDGQVSPEGVIIRV